MADDKIKSEYDAVCGKLNMDQGSMDAAWESYKSIKDYYTLEVGFYFNTCNYDWS